MLPTIIKNPDYAAFKNYVNDKSIVCGLDDKMQVNDDISNKMATQLWMEALSEKKIHQSIATDDSGLATGELSLDDGNYER